MRTDKWWENGRNHSKDKVPCQAFQAKPSVGGNHSQSWELTPHPLSFSPAPSLRRCVHRGKGHAQLWLLAVKICAKSWPSWSQEGFYPWQQWGQSLSDPEESDVSRRCQSLLLATTVCWQAVHVPLKATSALRYHPVLKTQWPSSFNSPGLHWGYKKPK